MAYLGHAAGNVVGMAYYKKIALKRQTSLSHRSFPRVSLLGIRPALELDIFHGTTDSLNGVRSHRRYCIEPIYSQVLLRFVSFPVPLPFRYFALRNLRLTSAKCNMSLTSFGSTIYCTSLSCLMGFLF